MSLYMGKVEDDAIIHLAEGERTEIEMAVNTQQSYTNFISTGTYLLYQSTIETTDNPARNGWDGSSVGAPYHFCKLRDYKFSGTLIEYKNSGDYVVIDYTQ